jgi:hypothetical protein
MELLIAVLIAFGVVTSNDAANMSAASAEKLVKQNNITKAQIDKQAAIIGLEESDF